MATSPIAQLNAMATTRKRGRPRGSTDSAPRKRQAVQSLEGEQHVDEPTETKTPTIRADPPPTSTRLKRVAKSISFSTPARGDSKYDVPISPQEQDHAHDVEGGSSTVKNKIPRVLLPRVRDGPVVQNAAVEPRLKLKKRQFNRRDAHNGADVFSGKQFGSLQEAERGAILTSINTPAKPKRSKSSRKLNIQSVITESPATEEVGLILETASDQDKSRELNGQTLRTAPKLDTRPESGHEIEDVDALSTTNPQDTLKPRQPRQDGSQGALHNNLDNKGDNDVDREDARELRRESIENDMDVSCVRSPSVIHDANDQNHITAGEGEDKDKADERRKAQFMKGIEDCSQELGIAETLADIGTAALKIKYDFSTKKEDDDNLRTTRSRTAWRRLAVLKGLYTTASLPDQQTASHAIEKLQRAMARNRLQKSPTGDQPRGDVCVLDLFHYIVPRSVELIRRALLAYRTTTFPAEVVEQVLCLVEIAYGVSDVALEWRPKPILESGLRGRVHNDIRPRLRRIKVTVKARLDLLRAQEATKLRKENLIRSQQARLADIEQARRRLLAGRVQLLPHQIDNVMDEVDEIPESEDESPSQQPNTTQNKLHSRTRIVRRNTADIPAPDPSTVWTDRESKFLIDGLIRHTGPDRFEAIAAIPALEKKDIDQIVAMSRRLRDMWAARMHQRGNGGDRKYEWLVTVP